MLTSRLWFFVVTVVAMHIAYILQTNFLALQRDNTVPIAANPYLDHLSTLQSPPTQIHNTSLMPAYSYGRYSGPIPILNFAPTTSFQDIFHRKKWHFVAVSSGDTIVGLAVADMGYLISAFVYYLNITSNMTEFEQVVAPKLPFSTPLATASVVSTTSPTESTACSVFKGGLLSSLSISICAQRDATAYDLAIDAKFPQLSLVMNTSIRTSVGASIDSNACEHFSMLYPLGPHRPAYTNKLANCEAKGHITTTSSSTGASSVTSTSSALIDYTNGMPSHLTTWYWVAITTSTWGLQMSTGVYSDKQGVGMENIFWYHGQMHSLYCAIDVQSGGSKNPLPGSGAVIIGREAEIECNDPKVHIKLTYYPMSQVPTTVNTPLLSGSLLHTYGVYRGNITVAGEVISVGKVPGILEDHFAYW